MEFDDRALLVDDTLVVADLHVGTEASSVELPLGERADLVDRLAALLVRHDPRTVAFAGDLLDSFGSIPRGVPETVQELTATVREAGARVVATPGNHDQMLAGLWPDPTTAEYAVEPDTVVLHGHEPPETDARRYVVGHEHPTIEIEGQRRPCYLVGEQAVGEVVMLPAFTHLVRGVDVGRMRTHEFQSPLVTDADALRPVVWDADAAEPVSFPPLGEFRGLL
ncbi:MAG: metallophosphoesterase [Haloarculaceae archaeon]